MKKIYLPLALIVCISLCAKKINAQTTLSANGPGNTYELINSVLAPGYDAVEAPDAAHSGFGRHIAEVFDAGINKNVFEFYSHLSPDNDPSTTATDRQRVEIKTYNQSPASLIGTTGETITYKWLFKIPAGFQPSTTFTHLHQIKPVDGDDTDPLFTLTARKGTPNKLELTYTAASSGSTIKPAQADLSLFEGNWVEVTEKILVSGSGKYSISVKRVSDGAILLSYYNSNILTIRPDNSFIRPKWGIYRSIANPGDLRDEAVRFADFSITEGLTAFSQTYYFTGNIAQTSMSSTTNWNTQLDGSGDSRSLAGAQPDDILIIDGTNVGGSIMPAVTGTVNLTVAAVAANNVAQFKLQNNAAVLLQRPAGGGGTGTLNLAGDGTADPDFVIGAGSSLTINSPLADGNINVGLAAGATGLVGGTMTLSNTGTHRITSLTTDGLVFTAGGTFNSDGTPASAAYPFGSSSQGVQNGVVFQAGANLVVTGNRSPMAGTSTFQSCNMLAGSNTYFRSTNALTGFGSWSNLKTFGNVFIENNSTFSSDGPFYKIDTLTIATGSIFRTHSSGNTPVLGNLVVNGSLLSSIAASTNIVVLGANVPQTISGSGTINIPSLTVANYSDVTLNKSVAVANTINIVGKINFGTTGQFTGPGTFTARTQGSAASVTGNTTVGSFQVTGVSGALSGNTGLIISGAGLDANTNVAGFSTSNSTINLSKPALSTTTGTTFTFTSDSATLVTANANGMDSLSGSVVVTGLKSFQSGTNYIINAATTKPLGISSSTTAPTSISAGNVTINAPVTLNYNARIRGTFTLNSGIVTIRPLDTLRITSSNAIAGAPFSSSKYFVCGLSGDNSGVLRIDDIPAARLFPVGTTTRYLPVSLSPASLMDYAVRVYEGVTQNGLPTGTPFSPAQKADIVDAVWTIDRKAGAGDCAINVNWPAALEGSNFTALSDGAFGIGRYNGTIWDATIGTGNNTANTASATFTNFSPFYVAKNSGALAVRFNMVSATLNNAGTEVKWTVSGEEGVQKYAVEKSTDGRTFNSIGFENAIGKSTYYFTDNAPVEAINYYRIKVTELGGRVVYSAIVTVKKGNGISLNLYPNPVTDVVSISGLKNNSSIKIVGADGKIMMEQKTNASSTTINTSLLKPGFYIVEIFFDNAKQESKSFIKQ